MAATVLDLARAMEAIAPLRHAAEWDNVGLLLGSTAWPLDALLLTTDLTSEVLDEAVAIDAAGRAIVAYHPAIFRPQARLTDESPTGRIALRCARAGIALYSPHTALDAAPGGLGDWLAQAFPNAQVAPLEPAADLPASEATKLVTFCPVEAVDGLREGLARAGAGRIGNYELCSFELRGQGTFLGNEDSQPAIGRRGALERVDEVRLEMVCARRDLAAAIAALRAAHPYEEPPIEVHGLEPRPRRDAGAGRRIELGEPLALAGVAALLKRRLGIDRVRIAAPAGGARPVRVIGLCPGAGGELLEPALAAGCDLFFTGEMRHHDVLAARERGCAIVLAGHTETERPYLPVLADCLRERLGGVRVTVATRDRAVLELV
jgi:dinuclear metal center YbgI/SA1388 family protein